ncbi:zinc finger, C3HC4 type (RING finger) domain containing protein [Acanthamoeba castellanii str. Neff]|uniref:Zinc finger, C3HC4 type (RING finger) domain containing protein n=1 Tax=Acanthamoeba castellanii (strain ATCC 30010 / Neff) TaxID=1257118 RepID=L8H471_ACACF|nr:zinc finger, C3HC4 type (RING finger) domain containing protein [Acanthamoeba castellanii str. Neff]ELR19508.1 zinc finger, C3HC4 type (RING finger) domain containing protein [Acanthamoeba castellanii str. Neff]
MDEADSSSSSSSTNNYNNTTHAAAAVPGEADETTAAASSSGGLVAVEEALTCPICVDALRDAVETPCCHATYCRACIEAWLERRRGHGCPGCRAAMEASGLRRCLPIQRLVDLLPAECPNVPCRAPYLTRGCMKEHMAKCEFAPVVCPYDSRCPTYLRGEWNEKHQATGVLLVQSVDAFKCVWMDQGTGSKMDGSVFRPLTPEGTRTRWSPVGYFFRPRHSEALREKVEVFALAEKVPNGTYLRPPTDFELIWNDKKTGAKRHCSIWRPIPPPGFVALGYVVTPHHNKPTLEAITCVHHSCVRACSVSPTRNWSDAGSGGAYDVTVWALDGAAGKSADGRSFYLGVDCAAPGYTRPSHPVYCLDTQAIAAQPIATSPGPALSPRTPPTPPTPPPRDRALTLGGGGGD